MVGHEGESLNHDQADFHEWSQMFGTLADWNQSLIDARGILEPDAGPEAC